MLLDDAEESKEGATYRAIQNGARQKIEDAVVSNSGLISGALAATELDTWGSVTPDGMVLFNSKTGAQIHIDLANDHGHQAGPHLDFQGSIKSKTKTQRFMDGFMAGLGF